MATSAMAAASPTRLSFSVEPGPLGVVFYKGPGGLGVVVRSLKAVGGGRGPLEAAGVTPGSQLLSLNGADLTQLTYARGINMLKASAFATRLLTFTAGSDAAAPAVKVAVTTVAAPAPAPAPAPAAAAAYLTFSVEPGQ